MEKIRVCVDAVGGDEEPEVVLAGIRDALSADPDLEVLVAGPEEVISSFCDATERAVALCAPQVITMEDDPISAVMTKRKSSIVLGCRAVKKGDAQAFFSAGATGAITAAATAYITPFKYEQDGERRPVRPCLTSAVPNRRGGFNVFCDMGANPDVEPLDIVRFAQMGSAYARCMLGVESPSVGLLANGTEDSKGSKFTKECFPLMRELVPGFAGNCEGGDVISGDYDVVVCDGFSGNIALKAIEGTAKLILGELKGTMLSSFKGKLAALMIKDGLKEIKEKLSGDAHGGVVLLGLKGIVLIGHGATSAEAVKNGTLAAARAVRQGLTDRVATSMGTIV